MKISDLESLLKQYRKDYGDVEVVLSADSEGNAFSTAWATCAAIAEDLGVSYVELSFEDSFSDRDEFVGQVNCVVLWP